MTPQKHSADVSQVNSIQSNGCLLAGDRETGLVTHVSANFLRLVMNSEQSVDPASVLGDAGSLWLGSAWGEAILATLDSQRAHVIRLRADGRLDPDWWECFAYSCDGYIVFQFTEFVRGTSRLSFSDLDTQLNRLRLATTIEELCEFAAHGMQVSCKFDAVVVERFRSDGRAVKVAVAGPPDRNSLDREAIVRSPDAPAEARQFYRDERFRLVADSHSAPVPVLAAEGEKSLDLSAAYLRGATQTHRDYLMTANIHSAMSIAIRHGDRVWGQLVGYMYSPHFSRGIGWYEVRGLSNLYGDALESCLSNITARKAAERVSRLEQGMAASIDRTQLFGLVDEVLKAWLLSSIETIEFPYVGFVDQSISLLAHAGEVHDGAESWASAVEDLFYRYFSVTQDRALSRVDLLADDAWLASCPPQLQGMAGIHVVEITARKGLLIFVGWGLREGEDKARSWDFDEAIRFREFSKVLVTWLEVYENAHLREQLRFYHYRNVVTNMHNRRFLRDYLTGQLAPDMSGAETKHHFDVFMLLDVQDFKDFNARLGSRAADLYLRDLSDVLHKIFYRGALLTHLDSDNFAVLLECRDKNHAAMEREAAALIETVIDEASRLAGDSSPDLVIGAVICSGGDLDYSDLLAAADIQLQKARDSAMTYSLA